MTHHVTSSCDVVNAILPYKIYVNEKFWKVKVNKPSGDCDVIICCFALIGDLDLDLAPLRIAPGKV